MALDRWYNCDLDPANVQLLREWQAELNGLENDFIVNEATLNTQLALLNAPATTAASRVFGTAAADKWGLVTIEKLTVTKGKNRIRIGR